jgi:hypothetical protein
MGTSRGPRRAPAEDFNKHRHMRGGGNKAQQRWREGGSRAPERRHEGSGAMQRGKERAGGREITSGAGSFFSRARGVGC